MQYFPPALERLTEQFARLPGIGHKSAQRLAFFVLSQPEEDARAFADAIVAAKRSISLCPVCQNLTEGEGPCAICRNEKRDGGVVCVVADPKDVVALERARGMAGATMCSTRGHLPMNHVRARRPAHQGTDGAGVRRRGAGGHHGHQRIRRRGHRHVSVPSVDPLG